MECKGGTKESYQAKNMNIWEKEKKLLIIKFNDLWAMKEKKREKKTVWLNRNDFRAYLVVLR